jgi:hypothetical protein
MNEHDSHSTGPRGIDHDRIEELTKEYRLQMEADPDDPVSAKAREESAAWASEVQAGRYPALEAANRQKQDLLAARRRVKDSTGRSTGLRQVDPGMSKGILSEPAGPPGAAPEESLDELFRSAEAPDSHVPRIDRQTAHDPALHPSAERLATPADELIHHGIPYREEPAPGNLRAQSSPAPAPEEAVEPSGSTRLHHRVIRRVKSIARRARGR